MMRGGRGMVAAAYRAQDKKGSDPFLSIVACRCMNGQKGVTSLFVLRFNRRSGAYALELSPMSIRSARILAVVWAAHVLLLVANIAFVLAPSNMWLRHISTPEPTEE